MGNGNVLFLSLVFLLVVEICVKDYFSGQCKGNQAVFDFFDGVKNRDQFLGLLSDIFMDLKV